MADTNTSTASSQPNGSHKAKYHIAIPPPETAQDTALVAYLTQLVNEVYHDAEAGIFDARYIRTSTSEVAEFLSAGLLALASISHDDSPWHPASNIQGCIRIKQLSPSMGEIGVLVAAPASRGSGLGRQLVDFAEEHCRAWGATQMKLELLVPTSFEHELKTWIQAWYQRLGYEMVGVADFGKTYPHLAGSIIGPTDYRVFEKVL